MMNDDLDPLMRDAADTYNVPPEIPREAMWEAISRARDAAAIVPIGTGRRAQRWLAAAAGIAAVLMVGIVIGRSTRGPQGVSSVATIAIPTAPAAVPQEPGQAAPTEPASGGSASEPRTLPAPRHLASTNREPRAYGLRREPSRSTAADQVADRSAYRMAVLEHLTRTEVLLTGFRAQSRSGSEARLDAQFATLSRELLGTTRLLLATRRGDDPTITRLLEDLELILMQLSQYATDGRRVDLDAINQSLDKRNVIPKLRSTIPAGVSASAGT